MRNFNKVRKAQEGLKAYIAGIPLNNYNIGTTDPLPDKIELGQGIKDATNKVSTQQYVQNLPNITDKFNKFGNGVGSLVNTYGKQINKYGDVIIQSLNKDMKGNSSNIINGAGNAASFITDNNPWAKVAQVGFSAANRWGGAQSDEFIINSDVAERMGGSYSGTYDFMNKTQSNNGFYGMFDTGARKDHNANVAEQQRIQNKLENIDAENQARQAMSANVQFNTFKYNNKLRNTLDFNKISFIRNGNKLENINRVKKLRYFVNVNTKQIEEFKQGGNIESEFIPVITEPIDSFKQGGIVDEFIPIITDPIEEFKQGGKTEETELVTLEETSQKNVIPEGALHKNKHHIENTEGLTQKGIPVIDNEGEQQAEIELDEIIFTLEVTKKLEELHKLYKEGSNKERDEAAIEAGKLLVQEILYNTDDRTGLIAKCEKGGKL